MLKTYLKSHIFSLKIHFVLLNSILLKYVIKDSKYHLNHLKRNLYNKFHIIILIFLH